MRLHKRTSPGTPRDEHPFSDMGRQGNVAVTRLCGRELETLGLRKAGVALRDHCDHRATCAT